MGKIKGWSLIKTPRRKQEKVDKKLGIIYNGEDNAYPQRMENFINNSVTAKMCANMYARFLRGNGFIDQSLNDVIVGKDYTTGKDITARKLLNQIAWEVARHYGVYINVGYNGNLKADSLKLITSKYCRLGKPDDRDYSGKILVYDNWDIDSDKRIDKKEIKVYNTYSDKEEIIRHQVTKKLKADDQEVLKSIKDWKGQIYVSFFDDEYAYPLSPIDPAQHDADTEFQISLFKNGELRRGFFAKYIIAYDEFEDDSDRMDFEKDMKSFEGASEGGSVLMIEGVEKDETGKYVMPIVVEKIEQNINDKLFDSYEKSVANNIRKCFNNIPPVLVDYQEGKLGNTSGESMREAIDFYNDQTRADREIISSIFSELMWNWHDQNYKEKDWAIKEIDQQNDTNNTSTATGNQTNISE